MASKPDKPTDATASSYHFAPARPRMPSRSQPKMESDVDPPASARESRDSHASRDSAGEPRNDPAGHPSRRDGRINCSFPGVMKVLVPEKSFIPVPIAVRVANLSAGGALIELHDRAKLQEGMGVPDRFFELKIAHPEIPEMRGTIAWWDFERENPLVGLTFFERRPELSQLLQGTGSAAELMGQGPPPLEDPVLDPFSPVSHEETVVLTGVAPGATQVVAELGGRTLTTEVSNGRFELKLELDPQCENRFLVRSRAGKRLSRGVPVRIEFERRNDKQRFTFNVTKTIDRDGHHVIRLEFSANMRQAERMMYRFSQLQAQAERMVIDATISAEKEFDQRLFDALRSEGRVLAADTSRNEVAAKLLDELLF
jgi:c-di-GMP-binding flagellar brake protein YcgR